jgi:hypothetical protein
MATLPARAAGPTEPPLHGAMAFWIAVGATLLVHFAPFGDLVGRPMVWFATMVHELGHGVTAILTGGEFIEFKMWSNGSGVAPVRVSGELSYALVSAGGLVGPSMAAALGFAAARSGRWARIALLAVAIVLLWALVFKVRNLFGAGFVASMVALCGGVALLAAARGAQLVLMFLSVQLALALWSDVDYMFSDTAATSAGTLPSDSAAIASALGGTYWMWGGLCGLVSLLVLAFGAWEVLRDRPARRLALR